MVLLDGPTGTELQRKGFDTRLPLWSARALLDAPETVQEIHEEYIGAGANVITTNSFRTNRRVAERAGLPDGSAEELTRLSVQIAQRARQASGRVDVLVAGSDAPVEDCYEPDLVPTEEELYREHAEHLRWLAEAGSDFLLIETMNTLREAQAACKAASELHLPYMVSLVTTPDGDRILSGESLEDAIRVLHSFQPTGILINCSAPRSVLSGTSILAAVHDELEADWKFGGYPNSGEPDPVLGWEFVHTVPVHEFTESARRMIALGATVVGSCCGTTPEYTRELHSLLANA